jgi:hypothetical protein
VEWAKLTWQKSIATEYVRRVSAVCVSDCPRMYPNLLSLSSYSHWLVLHIEGTDEDREYDRLMQRVVTVEACGHGFCTRVKESRSKEIVSSG